MARKGNVNIKNELCKGCYLCIRACPKSVITVDQKINSSGIYPAKAVNVRDCMACGNCWTVCPDICMDVYEEVRVRAVEENYMVGAA
jgi:2-oxoglutarate ferredoxin oxidoreductase subunit delta